MTSEQKKMMGIRSLVKTVFSVLKIRMNLEITLPRSINGYFSHYIIIFELYLVINLENGLEILILKGFNLMRFTLLHQFKQ